MIEHFDLIVLGTGPAASRIAKRCAESLKVAIVEAREVGGECALRGMNWRSVTPSSLLTSSLSAQEPARFH